MATSNMDELHRSMRASKRRRTDQADPDLILSSLTRKVSPPLVGNGRPRQDVTTLSPKMQCPNTNPTQIIRSPFQLTRIEGLSEELNGDTLTLHDLLGDPLIKECWQFNYLFDIDFLMRHFDEDVRSLVHVRVVHGLWRREDVRRQNLEEVSRKYENVRLIVAHMPEPFGTHHTKMMVLLRHDDTAEIIIHTANMIELDWTLMSQAIWRSPRLPLLDSSNETPKKDKESIPPLIGSGERFKIDFLRYLQAYGKHRTGSLAETLQSFDFGEIRAALVASVPTREQLSHKPLQPYTSWGWPGLREILGEIAPGSAEAAKIVVQVSSIATFNEAWFTHFTGLLKSVKTNAGRKSDNFCLIFPTPDEIRRSVGGYRSGGSIHMKTQSAQQTRQLAFLRPHLHYWAGDADASTHAPGSSSGSNIREAGRRRAAPHIKTFIRFTNSSMESIDWAMVTSANLSKQAWGELVNAHGEVRICSWELGVIVWPDLFKSDQETLGTLMVPSFKKDTPAGKFEHGKRTVGIRMPYDLPIQPYGSNETPWCATMAHLEPDWKGQTWTR